MTDVGTFLFPPASYASTSAFASFWAAVPISDGVLSNITAGYGDLIRRQKIAEGVAWGHRYDNSHEQELHGGSESARVAARDRRGTAYESFMNKWHETHPERIRAGSARAIARAGQAYFYATALDDAGKDEVRSSTIIVGDEEVTIAEACEIYQLHRIRDYFQGPEATAADRLEDVRVELRNMQTQ